MIPGIRIRATLQKKINKFQVGHTSGAACSMQGRRTVRHHCSVDIDAVVNKLSCQEDLICIAGAMAIRVHYLGQLIEQHWVPDASQERCGIPAFK